MPTCYDTGQAFTKYRETAQKTLIVSGFPTRTGVLRYLRDGKIYDELRPPDEVRKVLGQISHSPVVGEHRTFTPQDADHLEGVAISDAELQPDGWVKADFHMLLASAISDIKEDRRRQLSGGYDEVRREFTPGWWDATSQTFQLDGSPAPEGFDRTRAVHFDVVQRDLKYNHTKLCRVGRAGAKGSVVYDSLDGYEEDPATDQRSEAMEEVELEIDGIRYKVKHAVAVAVRDELKALSTANDSLDAEKQSLQEQLQTAITERDTALGKVTALEAAKTTAPVAKAHDDIDPGALTERLKMLALGSHLKLPYLKDNPLACAKTNAEIRKDCVAARYDSLDLTGKNESEIAGMFLILQAETSQEAGAFDELIEASRANVKPQTRRAVAHDEDDADADFFKRVTEHK